MTFTKKPRPVEPPDHEAIARAALVAYQTRVRVARVRPGTMTYAEGIRQAQVAEDALVALFQKCGWVD